MLVFVLLLLGQIQPVRLWGRFL